jgi:hypothetical protein
MTFDPAHDEPRVIRFRPRNPGGASRPDMVARRQGAPDDEPTARGNLLAIAVVVTLMSIGGWVISSMEKVESAPQCVASDGGPCPPFYVPPPRNQYRPSLVPSIGRG